MLISIVIPTFNRSQMLGDTLTSLVQLGTDRDVPVEIVVVDNASTDDTRVTAERFSAQAPMPVRYVFEAMPGDANARNRGVAEARGEWLAFLDDDETAESGWLRELYTAAEEAGGEIVGGAVRLDLSEEERIRLGRLCRRALRETEEANDDRVHVYLGNRLPGGGNVLVKRSVFNAIGAFDTTLVAGGSDSDFVLRARRAGYRFWHAPKAIVRHRIPISRLAPEYLRWDSHRDGIALATLDLRHKGFGRMFWICIARIAQAVLVNGPLCVWAVIERKKYETLGRMALLWRTVGYARGCLLLSAPRLFAQKRFVAPLEFRKRGICGKESVAVMKRAERMK